MPRHGATILKNKNCIYCGMVLCKLETTKEHVIGRRFVPKGKLENQWNLIANCCRKCNSDKSDLENDISAITLALTAASNETDPEIVADARRKLEDCISRKTKIKVVESQEKLTINSQFAGCSISAGCIGPPQIEPMRINELCRLHISGFFYLITYNNESLSGHPLPGGFYPIQETPRSDWGNSVHLAFMRAVQGWNPRVLGSTANEFFRIAIRRHPSYEMWAWAIEWNKSYRSIGCFGNYEASCDFVKTLPTLTYSVFSSSEREVIRGRREIPLSVSDDILFT